MCFSSIPSGKKRINKIEIQGKNDREKCDFVMTPYSPSESIWSEDSRFK